jgi:ribosomal protein L28
VGETWICDRPQVEWETSDLLGSVWTTYVSTTTTIPEIMICQCEITGKNVKKIDDVCSDKKLRQKRRWKLNIANRENKLNEQTQIHRIKLNIITLSKY